MNEHFDPYHAWLGIPPQEQPADYYRLLGIERLELNTEVVVHAAQRQLDHLHRCATDHPGEAAAVEDQITAARDCLLDRKAHRKYAATLQGFEADSSDLAVKAAWREFASEFDRAWQAAQELGFDPQHHWLAIPRHQRPASNIRLLGLSIGERNPDVIQSAAERQISYIRKFVTGESSEAANDLLRQLSRARRALIQSAQEPNQIHGEQSGTSVAPPPGTPLDESDWADLDTTVPIPALPLSNPAQASGRTQPVNASVLPRAVIVGDATSRRYWKLGIAFASAVVVLLFIFLAADFYRKVRHDARVAEANARVQELLRNRNASQAEQSRVESNSDARPPGGRVAPNSAHSAADQQSEAALKHLNEYELQLVDLESRPRENVSSDDRALISILRRNIDRVKSEFPKRTRQVDELASQLEKRASALLFSKPKPARRSAALPAPLTPDHDAARPDVATSAGVNRSNDAEHASQSVQPSQLLSDPTVSPDSNATAGSPPVPPNQGIIFTTPRQWHRISAAPFAALLVKADESDATFKSPHNERVMIMPIDQLEASDQAIVKVAFYGDQEKRQFNQSRTLLERVESAPEDAVDVLKRWHNAYRIGPYAGLWAAVGMSSGSNHHKEAASMLRQVISRIERQRKSDPGRHAMTLTSASNNLALCMLKDHKFDAAAGLLAQCLETMPLPSPIVIHNARQLRDLSSTSQGTKSVSRRKLESGLKSQVSRKPGLATGWYYALDVDLPRYDIDPDQRGAAYLSGNKSTIQSTLNVRDTWCIDCKGLGFDKCEYGNCHLGVISVKRRVQVAINRLNGEPIYGNKSFKQNCPHCGGKGRFECRHCNHGRLR